MNPNTNPMDNPNTLRWAALFVGGIALIVGSRMSYKFGSAMSPEHGYGLALLAIAGCIIMPASVLFKSKTFRNIGMLFLAVELFSHIGYSVGTRVMNTEQTGVQNAAWEVKQESAKRNAAQLAQYKSDRDKLLAANPWAVSVSADGLRAQLAPMQLAIEQETARGGCGPKCLALTKDKAAIEDKIAVVEKDNSISTQIALLEAEVNKREDMATTAEFKSSPVVAQTMFVSQIWTLSLAPDEYAKTATTIFVGLLLALATTFLAPSMFSVFFGAVKLPEFGTKTVVSAPIASAPYSTADAQVSALRDMVEKMQRRPVAPVSTPSTHTKELMVVKEDDPRAKQAFDALSKLAEEARQLKAAA